MADSTGRIASSPQTTRVFSKKRLRPRSRLSNARSPGSCANGIPIMALKQSVQLVILGAVRREIESLFPLLRSVRTHSSWGESFRTGMYGACSILLGTTGIGKVNAAATTAYMLERFEIGEVWNVGCAGAYEDGPLGVGDVLITRSSIMGDEGILSSEGALSSRGIGIPVVVSKGEEFYDSLPLDRHPGLSAFEEAMPEGWYRLDPGGPLAFARPYKLGVGAEDERKAAVEPEGGGDRAENAAGRRSSVLPAENDRGAFRLLYGPSLSVSMVSGDMEVARERFQRYGAFAENMEGSAAAQTCFRFGVPVVEIRGMSNIAGNRNKEDWRLDLAMARCHGIIMNRLKTLQAVFGDAWSWEASRA